MDLDLADLTAVDEVCMNNLNLLMDEVQLAQKVALCSSCILLSPHGWLVLRVSLRALACLRVIRASRVTHLKTSTEARSKHCTSPVMNLAC